VLADPFAHMCNVTFATGAVPSGLKVGKITPVYQGNGKDRKNPTSYRPVSILSKILSKMLEILAKSDLERHLQKTNGLLSLQLGLRSRQGCSTALGTAHTGWLKAAAREGIVGILGFNLSSAFDTVNAELLLPKLERLGIAGRALFWHKSYITGGQAVCCLERGDQPTP
jgi:hypothetical protein